jgi:uncharacterized membrane protein
LESESLPTAGSDDGSDPAIDELISKVKPYIRPDKAAEVSEIIITHTRSHSGPLPTPEMFAGYDHVLPGAAQEILDMAKREQAHRHKNESYVVTHELIGRYVGQISALIALLALLACVGYCAAIGQPVAAGVIAAIGAVVIGFLKYSTRHRQEEQIQKAPPPQKSRRKRR